MTYRQADRERWVAEDPAQKRSDRDEFARDRGRLIHSSALRRLSAKTQVLQPGIDDFVRNRLTHSLEVAQIGREFGAALGCNADVVDTACLAHDLGHPPFGHNGERALRENAAEIGGFEGNAQTLRILTRLEAKRAHPDGRPAGLNLTRASLDAATKYPWRRGEHPSNTVKFGAYEDDVEVFEWIRRGAEPFARCLEAQVMDWSDDVAYSVHDVEDGVVSGRVDLRLLHDRGVAEDVLAEAILTYSSGLDRDALGSGLEALLTSGAIPEHFDGSRGSLAAMKDMTSRLIGRFCLSVEVATRERYGPGDLTRHGVDLIVPDQVRAEVAVLKAVAAHFVMQSRDRRQLYRDQRQIIHDLVAMFAQDPEGRLDADLLADHRAASSDAAAHRVIIDQVAQLTDVRALELYQRWS